jgi:hypothetical protein
MNRLFQMSEWLSVQGRTKSQPETTKKDVQLLQRSGSEVEVSFGMHST